MASIKNVVEQICICLANISDVKHELYKSGYTRAYDTAEGLSIDELYKYFLINRINGQEHISTIISSFYKQNKKFFVKETINKKHYYCPTHPEHLDEIGKDYLNQKIRFYTSKNGSKGKGSSFNRFSENAFKQLLNFPDGLLDPTILTKSFTDVSQSTTPKLLNHFYKTYGPDGHGYVLRCKWKRSYLYRINSQLKTADIKDLVNAEFKLHPSTKTCTLPDIWWYTMSAFMLLKKTGEFTYKEYKNYTEIAQSATLKRLKEIYNIWGPDGFGVLIKENKTLKFSNPLYKEIPTKEFLRKDFDTNILQLEHQSPVSKNNNDKLDEINIDVPDPIECEFQSDGNIVPDIQIKSHEGYYKISITFKRI